FERYLREHFRPSDNLVWLGDINIAPKSQDVYNPQRFYGKVGHHPEEMSRLAMILDFPLTDVFRMHHPEGGHFTYWDFVIASSLERNLGWRIDHIYATPQLAERCTACEIDKVGRSA